MNANPTLIATQIQANFSFLLTNHILETSHLFFFIFSKAKLKVMLTFFENDESFQDREREGREEI